MRVWDIDPGFLNPNSLLGEHREIHALFTVVTQNKKGYSRHPETLRWKNCISGLIFRHNIVAEEMKLRKYNHNSPIPPETGPVVWPEIYIDTPSRQYELLALKYSGKQKGRIPLPVNSFFLWAFHKYSVMARDPGLYKKLGPAVSEGAVSFAELSKICVQELRKAPPPGRLANAVLHMWGYLGREKDHITKPHSLNERLSVIREFSMAQPIEYLQQSTAIGELFFWCRDF